MKKIRLTRNLVAIVDDEDYPPLKRYSWSAIPARGTFYAVRSQKIKRNKFKTVRMHREIMRCPDGLTVDHINHDGLLNTKSNLRIATYAQNNHNRRQFKTARSQYRGVTWITDRRCWRAQIYISGKRLILGHFRENEERLAALLVDQVAKKYHGSFARLNFPDLCPSNTVL